MLTSLLFHERSLIVFSYVLSLSSSPLLLIAQKHFFLLFMGVIPTVYSFDSFPGSFFLSAKSVPDYSSTDSPRAITNPRVIMKAVTRSCSFEIASSFSWYSEYYFKL